MIVMMMMMLLMMMISTQLWRMETIAESSEVPHLAMSATKLTLEWTKVGSANIFTSANKYFLGGSVNIFTAQLIVFLMTCVCLGVGVAVGVSRLPGLQLCPAYLGLTLAYYLSLEMEAAIVARLPAVLASR